MNKINKGLENKESAVNLLVKFFELIHIFLIVNIQFQLIDI